MSEQLSLFSENEGIQKITEEVEYKEYNQCYIRLCDDITLDQVSKVYHLLTEQQQGSCQVIICFHDMKIVCHQKFSHLPNPHLPHLFPQEYGTLSYEISTISSQTSSSPSSTETNVLLWKKINTQRTRKDC